MKPNTQKTAASNLVAVLLLALSCIVSLSPILIVGSSTGCSTQTELAPGHNPMIVNSERKLQTTFALADQFLAWEQANRATLSPDIRERANRIRRDFMPAYRAADAALQQYRSNPSDQNADQLTRSMLAIQAAYLELLRTMPTGLANETLKRSGQK